MKVVFHRYGSIVEPDILLAFKKFNIEVFEDDLEITKKNIDSDTRIRTLSEAILTNQPSFVFSINYFPYIAQICEKLKVYYICLSVDCPVLEIYSKTIKSPYNRVFLFDYEQYLSIVDENPEGIFYLPLATNVERWDKVLGEFDPSKTEYKYDVSFVGSLYVEKSVYRTMKKSMSEFGVGYFDGLINSQARFSGLSLLDEVFKHQDSNLQKIIREINTQNKTYFDRFSLDDSLIDVEPFVYVENILGFELSAKDRENLLNTMALNNIDTHIFTRSDASALDERLKIHEGISTHEEMPRVFRTSKININPTMRCIKSGLPQRIWDIMGCGGFVMTNIQNELPEYFEVGEDIVCYETLRDAVEVAQYYLSHEEERMAIAENGYNKVKKLHTYEIRVATMIDTVFGEA